MELEIHPYQAIILRELLFKPGARFSDLNKTEVTNDHFTFHLNRLIKEGLVVKENTLYQLTDIGKEFANRLDTHSLKMEKQGKITVAMHALRNNKGKTEYLIHQRLKEPFFGWYGSHSGKVRWGESPLAAAKREFLEETGLTGDFIFKGVAHVFHKYKDGNLLEDKYMWVYLIENIQGELLENVQEGKNIWMTQEEVCNLKPIFATFDEMSEFLETENPLFVERTWVVDTY